MAQVINKNNGEGVFTAEDEEVRIQNVARSVSGFSSPLNVMCQYQLTLQIKGFSRHVHLGSPSASLYASNGNCVVTCNEHNLQFD